MKIQVRLLIIIFVVVLLTGGGATLIGRTVAMNIVEDEISDHLVDTAQSRSQHIQDVIEGRREEADLMARIVGVYTGVLDAGLFGLSWESSTWLSQSFLTNMSSSGSHVDCALYVRVKDGEPVIEYSSFEELVDLDVSDTEFFLQGSKGTYIGDYSSYEEVFGLDSSYSEVFADDGDDFVLVLASPVWSEEKVSGVMVLLGGEQILSDIAADSTGLGETGEVYILNEDGYMITESQFIDSAVMNQKVDIGRDKPGSSGESGDVGWEVITATNNMEDKVLQVSHRLPETGWTVVVETGHAEAFAPVTNLTRIMLWSLLGVLLLGALMSLLVSRAISRPIVKLHRGADEIMNGNWEYDITSSAKDEVGELSRAFSKMTLSLKASHDELQNYSKNLEEEVQVRTQELADANRELSVEVADRKLAEEKVQEQYEEMQVHSLELEAANDELRLTQEKLQGVNEYLETRVAERTIELTRVNELLEEDIAKREEIEAELREKEAKLRAMFDAIGDGVNVTDLEGNIVEVNETYLRIFGLAGKEDVIGKNASAFILPKDHPRLVNHIEDALNSVNEVREYILIDSTGREFFGETSVTMIRDSLGNPVGFISVTRDISERKQAEKAIAQKTEELISVEEELRYLNQALDEKVAEKTSEFGDLLTQKDEFISQLSHDLKNPLTPLVGLVPMLQERETDPESKEYLDVIAQNIDYMRNLIAQTVERAKLNSKMAASIFEEVNLAEETEKLIRSKQYFYSQNNVAVENRIVGDIVVAGNRLELMEVMDNLASNAVKFMPDGDGLLIFDAWANGDVVTVSIKDNGIGLKEGQEEIIFDEFYADDNSGHELGSSGLGLSICKRIVESLGGRIWAESECHGKGTTIYFTIPVHVGASI